MQKHKTKAIDSEASYGLKASSDVAKACSLLLTTTTPNKNKVGSEDLQASSDVAKACSILLTAKLPKHASSPSRKTQQHKTKIVAASSSRAQQHQRAKVITSIKEAKKLPVMAYGRVVYGSTGTNIATKKATDVAPNKKASSPSRTSKKSSLESAKKPSPSRSAKPLSPREKRQRRAQRLAEASVSSSSGTNRTSADAATIVNVGSGSPTRTSDTAHIESPTRSTGNVSSDSSAPDDVNTESPIRSTVWGVSPDLNRDAPQDATDANNNASGSSATPSRKKLLTIDTSITPTATPVCNKRHAVGATSFVLSPRSPGVVVPRILILCIPISDEIKTIIKTLGAVLVETIEEASTATHIVAGSANKELRRTSMLMIGLCCTSNILSIDWLWKSFENRKILPCNHHLLISDRAAERKYSFSMKQTLRNGQEVREEGGLLDGWAVYFCKNVAGRKAPKEHDLNLIVSAAGGTVLAKSDLPMGRNVLVITSDPPTPSQISDQSALKLKEGGASEFRISWLFNCIMHQSLIGIKRGIEK